MRNPLLTFGPLEKLTVIFVILKATNSINWSWWWVFSPAIVAYLGGFVRGIYRSYNAKG